MENSVGDVITIDLAGHGLSDHLPVDGHYIVMQYALDLSNLLKKLSKSYREIRLVGHSLGAGVCILAERSQVCKLSSMVLIEGIGPMTTEDGMLGLVSAMDDSPPSKVRAAASEASRRKVGKYAAFVGEHAAFVGEHAAFVGEYAAFVGEYAASCTFALTLLEAREEEAGRRFAPAPYLPHPRSSLPQESLFQHRRSNGLRLSLHPDDAQHQTPLRRDVVVHARPSVEPEVDHEHD